jgi:hypothetical protein
MFETTRYSPDYPGERKSVLKAYLRPEKLRGKYHSAFVAIDSMIYTNRIEFSLKNRNCRYMALENLNGDYYQVLDWFMPFLASKWREYGDFVADVPCWENLDYAENFRQIVTMSKYCHIPHSKLVFTPKRLNFYRQYNKNEVDTTWRVKFFMGNNRHGM